VYVQKRRITYHTHAHAHTHTHFNMCIRLYDALSKTIPYPKLIYIFFYPVFGTNSLCDRKYIMRGGDGPPDDCVRIHIYIYMCMCRYNIRVFYGLSVYTNVGRHIIIGIYSGISLHIILVLCAGIRRRVLDFCQKSAVFNCETHRTCNRSCYKHFFSLFFPIRFTTRYV